MFHYFKVLTAFKCNKFAVSREALLSGMPSSELLLLLFPKSELSVNSFIFHCRFLK